MIQYHEAQKLIEEHTKTLQPVKLPLMESLGCALAENIFTKTPIPIFDSSAVDGYGVKVSDIRNASKENPVVMKLVGEIKAGDSSKLKLSRGECVRILTGAPVPLSIEAVVMKEFTNQNGDKIIFKTSTKHGDNVRYKGEEFKKGDKAIATNTFISPAVVGLLATFGIRKVKVFQKPKVAVLVTGNELVQIDKKIKPGQIYDSNFYTLSSALKEMDIDAINLGIAKDDKNDLLKKISVGLESADILLVSGGISVGEYDYVQDIFDELRVKKIFWRIAMKPGKPTYFGVKGKKLVFGLPGNPVASLLVFSRLVEPAIQKVMGKLEHKPIILFARLEHDLKKRSKRLEFVRAKLNTTENGELTVSATKGQDSHMLGGMVEANCLIYFPMEMELLNKGTKVKVELIH
ncbi:MAG: molybdopterin molybdotransferase MoeA [Bacteroidetes bacterium]|nr:molybdopterin molybdotransferase MoeA [Bacteroidota bacterium]MBU1421627.1 molybdopterin molybdotransferase MoeA [Bacteroidota bacterium]